VPHRVILLLRQNKPFREWGGGRPGVRPVSLRAHGVWELNSEQSHPKNSPGSRARQGSAKTQSRAGLRDCRCVAPQGHC
jgi:hypothetical protein